MTAVNDKHRYSTSDPSVDLPGLGENPDLAPLDRVRVRSQLSMIEPDSLADRDRAARLLLERVQQYYRVIGYVGPLMSGTSEIGCAMGGWICANNCEPWRERFMLIAGGAWETPEKMFQRVRFACFESALRLAAWEMAQEVPESAEALKRAAWLARNAIQQLSSRPWGMIRNRLGSAGMRKVLAEVIDKMDGYRAVQGRNWLGHYIPRERVSPPPSTGAHCYV